MRERKREIQILDQERSLRGSPEEKGWPIRFSQIPHSGVLFPTVPGRRRKRKKQGGEGRRGESTYSSAGPSGSPRFPTRGSCFPQSQGGGGRERSREERGGEGEGERGKERHKIKRQREG